MMRQMRENTKWIMLLTAAAFVALMVFEWGMDLSGQSSAAITGGEIGRINGESVNYEEYSVVYQNLYDQRQQQSEEPITEAENREVEDAAWDQIVNRRLIRQELARRGIEVTDDEIREAARYLPPPEFRQNAAFQTDGQFDIQKYHEFLATSASTDPQLLLQLEAYYRDVLPRNKLYQQIMAGVHVSDDELWEMWRDRNETVSVRYIAVEPRAVVAEESIGVDDAEIRDYYSANAEDFTRPAQARVRLVALVKTPTAEDTVASRERAESVRQEIVDGADFGDVAARESADPGSAENGGALTIQRGQTVPAFEQAAWSQPIGQVGEPVQSQFGFHIIRVDSRTEEEAEVRHVLIPVERSDASELRLLQRADSLDILGETMPLDAAADELGLSVRTASLTEDAPFVPGVGDMLEGGEWAFDDAAPGDVSPLFESRNAFYMLELVDRSPEHVPELADVEDAIRSRLADEKRRDAARDIAGDIADRIRSGASMEEAAAEYGLEPAEAGPFTRAEFVPGLGAANAAIGAAFGTDVGGTSNAVEANGQFVVIRTLEREPADRDAWEEQKDAQRMQVAQAMRQQRIQQFIEGLRERAEIEEFLDEVLRADPEEQQQQMQQPGLF